MAKRTESVPRPLKSSEYTIVFASNAVEKGWRDLRAQARNALADAWDFLTAQPLEQDGQRCYQLQGDLGAVRIDGKDYDQYQYKVTDGGRLWYAVLPPGKGAKSQGLVVLTKATAGHPKQTDSGKNFR